MFRIKSQSFLSVTVITSIIVSFSSRFVYCELTSDQSPSPTPTAMSQHIAVNLAYTCYDPVGGSNETLPPIIFLHGVTASKEMWCDLPQIIANKTKRKVYAVDARNHGDTEWNDFFDFDINADDLLHFMDTISAPKAVLLGHSMGGITSIRAALKCPERIEMVFVEDMYVKRLDQGTLDIVANFSRIFKEAVMQLPPETPDEDATSEVMKYIAKKMPDIVQNLDNNQTTESMCKLQLPLKRDANGRYTWKNNLDVIIKAMQNADTIMTEPKGLYEGPSYFIYGKVSPFKVNEDEENIRKFFPGAELIGVEDSDHSIHVQFPKEFIDIVVRRILKQ